MKRIAIAAVVLLSGCGPGKPPVVDDGFQQRQAQYMRCLDVAIGTSATDGASPDDLAKGAEATCEGLHEAYVDAYRQWACDRPGGKANCGLRANDVLFNQYRQTHQMLVSRVIATRASRGGSRQ